jgi:hypothetical protein
MIRIYMHKISQEIMPLDLQCMNNGQEFYIMSWIMLFMTLELSRGIGNHTALLHEYPSYTRARHITIHVKWVLDVRLSQHGCSRQKLLQREKHLFTLLTPHKLGILLQKFGHWFIWNKSAIIPR